MSETLLLAFSLTGKGPVDSHSHALMVSSHMLKLTAPGPASALVMEVPRKRKGSDSDLAQ